MTWCCQWLWVISLILSALFLSWQALRPLDFAYPLWYESMDIQQHIDKYGPRNRYRQGFAQLDKAEYLAYFSAINRAVHAGGRGLADLHFQPPGGARQSLLREAEITHLVSVARLVSGFLWLGWASLALWLLSLWLMWRLKLSLPRPSRVLAGVLAVAGVGTVLVLAVGPLKVFYTLHEWIFPAGEQWFFYYQDSLMTTLMKAPALFGAIAALLLALWLVFLALQIGVSNRLLARRA